MRAQPNNLIDVWLSPQSDGQQGRTDLKETRRNVESQPASQDGAALSKREKPSERLARVARRWDTPPISEQTVDPRQTFEGVRSKIVTTPAGELVLWGNRQTTLILEQARAMLGDPEPFRGLTLPRKGVDKIFPIILRVAHGRKLLGGDAGGLFKLAENLAVLSANNEGGIVAYIAADDTRTNAEVRISEMHESVHVAQLRIGRGTIKIVSAAWMRGDPDYRQITQSKIGQAYASKPTLLAAEAAAYTLSGQENRVGYNGADALERAAGFADRYLREVARLYGVEAVKKFSDIHPEMSAVAERIVTHGNKTQRAESRNRGRTQVRDGGGFAAVDEARSIGERERQSLGEWLREGWGGSGEEHAPRAPAGVGETEKSNETKSSLEDLKPRRVGSYLNSDLGLLSLAGHPDLQSQKAYSAADVSQAADGGGLAALPAAVSSQTTKSMNGHYQRQQSVGVRDCRSTMNAELIKSLQTISAIESIDPDGMRYTWRDLAVKSAGIARESLARYELKAGNLEALSEGRTPVELLTDNRLVEALQEIADVESLDPTKYSWIDRAAKAIDIAREALDHNHIQPELTARSEEYRVERRSRGPDYSLSM